MPRRNAWPEGGRGKTKAARRKKAHSGAGHIGWSYRKDRKKGPAAVMRYLASAGLSPAALKKYRGARKTKPSTLLSKRQGRKRKTGKPREAYHTRPFLVNRGRRAGSYARFVKAFSARSGLSGKSLFRAAGRAWRGGARRNQGLPGQVTFNKKRRGRSRRNGPVLPYMAFENKKRRKARGRKRSRRNAPVLPYASFNRGRRYRDNDPVGAIKASFSKTLSVDFWTDTVLPLGAGFVGGQFLGGIAYSFISKLTGPATGIMGSLQRVGARALGAIAASGIAVLLPFKGKKGRGGDIAAKVLAGGLVAVFAAILQEAFGSETYAKMTGMSDFDNMAADLTEELKARIADSVRGEIARAESGMPAGQSAFVTTQDIAPAPHLGPGPRVGEMGSFVSTQDLSTAPVANGDAPVVADLSAFSDSFADMMLV